MHIDAYRLSGADGESMGLSEYLGTNQTLVIIEWPENIIDLLSGNYKTIKFEHLGADQRKISSNL